VYGYVVVLFTILRYIIYLKFKGIDAKFDKPVQLLNASVPAGVGTLFHISGAVPISAFDVELIL
jgi:hypothetical protein